MILLKVSDYWFYRIYTFFKQRESSTSPPARSAATGLLSIVEICTVCDIYVLVSRLGYQIEFPSERKAYAIAFTVVIIGLNVLRYESNRKVNDIKAKWRIEDTRLRTQKGIIIVVYMIVVCVFTLSFLI